MKTDSRDAPSSRQDSIEATAKMLPCPNCGETNVDAAYSRGEEFLNAGCMVCGMTGPDSHTPLDAADRWNALPRGTSARLETGTTSVWEVYNKTSSALFESEELAQKYIGQFGASVGGGMSIAERPIHRVHPPASPAATPRVDALANDNDVECGWVTADFARTLERECADLRGKLAEAQEVVEACHVLIDDADLGPSRAISNDGGTTWKPHTLQYRVGLVLETCGEACKAIERAEAAEAKLSTARQDALEEAAKVADGYNYGPCGQYDYGYTDAQAKADERAGQIADDIRALKEEA